MLAAIRAAIAAFAPAEASLVDQAVARILAGEPANVVALDLGLEGEDRRAAADRAKAARPNPKFRRKRKAPVRCS